LLISEPGLAKSRLLRSITKLVPNSRYESGGPNSSGKSLTAIVSKEDETYVLRLGPIPLSKNALCAINEFGRTDFKDQEHFLDIMEEGIFTINKHGINATIKSPTTIIASANPINNSSWLEENVIDLNEVPGLRPILDRFDLIFAFRDIRNEDLIREYAFAKAELETKRIPDYSAYLVKHIEYAKSLNPAISDDAKTMLSEFFVGIKIKGFGSNRILDTLFRLSKAFARLKLKLTVDGNDAMEAIEFYNVVLQQYQRAVTIPLNPRDATYQECLRVLIDEKIGITLEELFKKACKNNGYIQRYLCFGFRGNDKDKPLRLRNNKKIRAIYQMLLNNTNLKRVQEKPVVLQWESRCDPCDPCDHEKTAYGIELASCNNKVIERQNPLVKDPLIKNSTSHKAHGSHRKSGSGDFPPKCYRCEFLPENKQEYDKHCFQKHRGFSGYPNLPSLEANGLEPQGMWWED
jgi:replicative DNA helicase Mcm